MSPFLRSLKYHINVKSFDSVALYIIFADYIFYLLTVGMTSEEITQTYHLSQNSMDDFYIAETPICSSQNSQISTNTLTIDTNFDDGHNDAKQDSDKSGMSTKLVDGIASSSINRSKQ